MWHRKAAAGVVIVGYAWVAGGFGTFTLAAGISTFAAGLVVLCGAVRITRAPVPAVGRASVIGWTSWIAAVTGWELWALFSGPRADHPTISSLVSPLIDTHPARACAILLWLALGWWLARR